MTTRLEVLTTDLAELRRWGAMSPGLVLRSEDIEPGTGAVAHRTDTVYNGTWALWRPADGRPAVVVAGMGSETASTTKRFRDDDVDSSLYTAANMSLFGVLVNGLTKQQMADVWSTHGRKERLERAMGFTSHVRSYCEAKMLGRHELSPTIGIPTRPEPGTLSYDCDGDLWLVWPNGDLAGLWTSMPKKRARTTGAGTTSAVTLLTGMSSDECDDLLHFVRSTKHAATRETLSDANVGQWLRQRGRATHETSTILSLAHSKSTVSSDLVLSRSDAVRSVAELGVYLVYSDLVVVHSAGVETLADKAIARSHRHNVYAGYAGWRVCNLPESHADFVDALRPAQTNKQRLAICAAAETFVAKLAVHDITNVDYTPPISANEAVAKYGPGVYAEVNNVTNAVLLRPGVAYGYVLFSRVRKVPLERLDEVRAVTLGGGHVREMVAKTDAVLSTAATQPPTAPTPSPASTPTPAPAVPPSPFEMTDAGMTALAKLGLEFERERWDRVPDNEYALVHDERGGLVLVHDNQVAWWLWAEQQVSLMWITIGDNAVSGTIDPAFKRGSHRYGYVVATIPARYVDAVMNAKLGDEARLGLVLSLYIDPATPLSDQDVARLSKYRTNVSLRELVRGGRHVVAANRGNELVVLFEKNDEVWGSWIMAHEGDVDVDTDAIERRDDYFVVACDLTRVQIKYILDHASSTEYRFRLAEDVAAGRVKVATPSIEVGASGFGVPAGVEPIDFSGALVPRGVYGAKAADGQDTLLFSNGTAMRWSYGSESSSRPWKRELAVARSMKIWRLCDLASDDDLLVALDAAVTCVEQLGLCHLWNAHPATAETAVSTRRVLGSAATAADLKDWLEFRSRRDDLPMLQATYHEDTVLVAWRHGVVLGPVVKAVHDLLNRTVWWLQPTAANRLASGVVTVPSGFQGPGEAPLHQCGRGTSLAQTDANDAMNLQIRSNSGSAAVVKDGTCAQFRPRTWTAHGGDVVVGYMLVDPKASTTCIDHARQFWRAEVFMSMQRMGISAWVPPWMPEFWPYHRDLP